MHAQAVLKAKFMTAASNPYAQTSRQQVWFTPLQSMPSYLAGVLHLHLVVVASGLVPLFCCIVPQAARHSCDSTFSVESLENQFQLGILVSPRDPLHLLYPKDERQQAYLAASNQVPAVLVQHAPLAPMPASQRTLETSVTS